MSQQIAAPLEVIATRFLGEGFSAAGLEKLQD
jgi:hypothetical protein